MTNRIITAADIVQTSVYCQIESQFTVNVYTWDITHVGGAGLTDDQFSAAFDSLVAPLYKALLSTAALYYGSRTQIIIPVRYDPVIAITNRGAGTLAGDPLPTQVAGVVSWRTGYADRRKKGRTFLPASTEAENDANAQPSAGYLTAADALANALEAFQNITVVADSLDFALAVFSRKTGDLTVISDHVLRTDWGTQRRRSSIGKPDAIPFT